MHPLKRERRFKTKKEREAFFFDLFRKWYSEFPTGRVEEGESPDFLIVGTDKSIGIEVTDWHIDQDKEGGSEVRRMLEDRERLVERAEQIFWSRNDTPVFVSLFFEDTQIKGSHIKTAERLATLLETLQRDVRDGEEKTASEELLERFDLTYLFWRVRLGRLFSFPTFFDAPNVVGSGNPRPAIEATIGSKELKLQEYRTKCDEAWLLIVANSTLAQSLPPTLQDDDFFPSTFDRVLLLSYADEAVIELLK